MKKKDDKILSFRQWSIKKSLATKRTTVIYPEVENVSHPI